MSIERLALVSDGELHRLDGVQRYVVNLGEWMSAAGIEVHYITSGSSEGEMFGGTVHSIARSLTLGGNGNRFSAAVVPKHSEILGAVASGYFDVVHFQLPQGPFVGDRVLRRVPTSTATVGTYHLMPHGLPDHLLLRAQGRTSRCRTDRIGQLVATSEVVSDYARGCTGRRAVVLPIPIPEPIPMMHDTRLRSTGSEFRIGFLGRLVARKGAHFLLPLLRPVSESIGREVQLSIAGAGPLAGSLDRQARKLGVRHQVDLLGSIADEERHSFMASQDVMAFPAASGESFGIVLGEAMRSSVPVLAGNNAGYAATMASIEDQLVDFRDQPRAIAALSKLAKLSGTERSELLERQATRVSAFAPDVVGAAMLSLYRQTQDSVRI